MKRIFSLAFLLLPSVFMAGQSVNLAISSKGLAKPAIRLQLLLGDGHLSLPSVSILPSGAGEYRHTISLPHPLFALLKYEEQELRLLLSPGRSLNIHLAKKEDSFAISFSGAGAPENLLLRSLQIGPPPFFMKKDWQENEYAAMSVDSLRQMLMAPLDKKVKDADALVSASHLPPLARKILRDEYRYVMQCYLNDLATNQMRWRKNADAEAFAEWVMQWQPVPDSSVLACNFFANMMWRYQVAYHVGKTVRTAGKDREKLARVMGAMFGTSFEKLNDLVGRYGERYIVGWLYARNQCSPSIFDKILLNKILDAANDGQYASADALLDTMEQYSPKSRYLSIARAEVNKMETALKDGKINPGIKINDREKPASFSEIISRYKGKVVYVDIWGTWCGPCRIEMEYVPELKRRYKNRDIVFIYLDMDADAKEDAWKEYVYLYGIEGEHFRLTKEQMEPLWNEVKQAGGETHLYPTYLLFDKKGALIKANAERPSSTETLYRQLNEVL